MSSFHKVCVCGRQALPGSSRCALHPMPAQTQSGRLQAQPWRRAYRDPVYRKNRARAWERSGHRCEACGAQLKAWEFVCDHMTALTDGGTNDLANLQILCVACSKVKTRSDRRARAERHRR